MAVGDDEGVGLGEGYGDDHVFYLGNPLIETHSDAKSLHTLAELATPRSPSTIDDWSQSINFDPPSSESHANSPTTTRPRVDEGGSLAGIESPDQAQSDQSSVSYLSRLSTINTQSALSFGDVATEPVRPGTTKFERNNCPNIPLALSEPQPVIALRSHHCPRLSPFQWWPHYVRSYERNLAHDIEKIAKTAVRPLLLNLLDKLVLPRNTFELEMFHVETAHRHSLLIAAADASPIRQGQDIAREFRSDSQEIAFQSLHLLLHETIDIEIRENIDIECCVSEALVGDCQRLARQLNDGPDSIIFVTFRSTVLPHLSVQDNEILCEGYVIFTIVAISKLVCAACKKKDISDFRELFFRIHLACPRSIKLGSHGILTPLLIIAAYKMTHGWMQLPEGTAFPNEEDIQNAANSTRAYLRLWMVISYGSLSEVLKLLFDCERICILAKLLGKTTQVLQSMPWFIFGELGDTQSSSGQTLCCLLYESDGSVIPVYPECGMESFHFFQASETDCTYVPVPMFFGLR